MVRRSINKSPGKSISKNKLRDSFEDKIFFILVYVILLFVLLVVALPILYILACSFSDANAVVSGEVFIWPVKFTLKGYEAIFNNGRYNLVQAFRNSLFYVFAGTLIAIVMTYICAYPLARKNLPGGKAIMMLWTITMFFSGGLIPSYLLINNTLGFGNTIWAIIIPGAINVQNMIIARTFISTSIPAELLEASQIDGCDDFGFLLKIVLPLSKASIAVLTLYYAVGLWNSYMAPLLYIQKDSLQPLQIVLRNIIINNEAAAQSEDFAEEAEQIKQLLKYSTIVVSVVPVLIMYPFIQKHFVKGVMIGSVKG